MGRKTGLGNPSSEGVTEDFLDKMIGGSGEAPGAAAGKPETRRGRKPDPDAALTVGAYFKLSPGIIKKIKVYLAQYDDCKSKSSLVEKALEKFFESKNI